MPKKKQGPEQLADKSAELQNHLDETEEILRAIRQYMVDAFLVTRENDVAVVTLNNADYLYRMMVESMNEGAVTLIPDGTIFYSNPRFAEMVQRDATWLVGIRFQDLIRAEQRPAFITMLEEVRQSGTRGEFCLLAAGAKCLPVQLSIFHLTGEEVTGVAVIVTDITERMEAAEKIRALASKLTLVEQDERKRISQILHDDLQQRMFAIKAQLSLLKAGQQGTSSSEALAAFDQLEGWLGEAITVARDLSTDLSPIVLQGDQLDEAIMLLASQMKERYGIQIELETKDNLDSLNEAMRILLFHAVRELLFNIVKHAGTLQATVILEQVDGRSRITVSDPGKGFDVEAIMNNPDAAHGLLIVYDRLTVVGGTMEVDSKPGNGTRITLELPQAASAA